LSATTRARFPFTKSAGRALRDASPNYWGRRVIEKHAGKVNLTELDYLLNSPDDRAGALGFGLNVEPPAPLRAFNRTMQLSDTVGKPPCRTRYE